MTKLTVAFHNFAKPPKQRDGVSPNDERAGKIICSLQENSFRLVRFHATRIILGTYLSHKSLNTCRAKITMITVRKRKYTRYCLDRPTGYRCIPVSTGKSSKTYRGYVKPRIIPNAIYNVIFV
jgi:hypothetical protein